MPASEHETAEWEPLFGPPPSGAQVSEPDSRPDRSERNAVRTMQFAVFAVAFVLIAGIISVVARHFADDGDDGDDAPTAGESVPPSGGIGPGPGQPIAAYVTEREAVLASLAETETRVAVVTFIRYRSEAETHDVIDRALGPGAVDVLARLVAVGGDQPHVVTGSLAEWAAAYRARVADEKAEIEKLIPTVEPGSEFAAFYANEVARLDDAIAGADPSEPVVYAAAVRGQVHALRRLAAAATVRLIDVGESDDPPAGDVYRGPLPDEVATIGDPQQRPAPVR